jgi:hypothetical protein
MPPAVKGKSCCSPDAKPTATEVTKVKVNPRLDWEALDSVTPQIPVSLTLGSDASGITHGNTGPPELDRVITLRRLLI